MSPDWASKPASVPYANFGDPQSLNLYAMVTGSPVSRQDSDGHKSLYEYWHGGWSGDGANQGEGGSDAGDKTMGHIFAAPTHTPKTKKKKSAKPQTAKPTTGPTVCLPVQFKVTGVGPKQAPGTTAITQTKREDIPDGGVAIKPQNLGLEGVNQTNRTALEGVTFTVDWSTDPNGVPQGIPTTGPFTPVDNIGPKSVRDEPGNQIDVYNYSSGYDAMLSTRNVSVTTYIPANNAGLTCPKP